MTITVEDGTIVTNANSYITTAELTTYGTDRGILFSGDTEQLLFRSMDYLEGLDFKGDKSTEGQPLQWPRLSVNIDGYYLDDGEIPQLLKDAQMEACIAVGDGDCPLATITRATKKEKVGDIEVEYMDNAAPKVSLQSVNNKLAKLLKNTGAVRTQRV